MLETMAYIILEVIFKMFCLLSPSAGVKFADVPTQCWPSSGCFPRWIDNSAWVDWVLYTFHRCVHSTDLQLVGRLGSYSVCPRLRSKTLGVQAPVGCWNPAGLSADCSSEIFKRRRRTELMLGLISMLATMAYITLEITGKISCLLSPSAGMKFADVPNGLAAIAKGPTAGWDHRNRSLARSIACTRLIRFLLSLYNEIDIAAVGIQQACPQIRVR